MLHTPPPALVDAARRHWGSLDQLEWYFAPGRVNLIGEHIDYNGGRVMPAALSIGIYVALRRDESWQLRLRSLGYDGSYTYALDEAPRYEPSAGWANYPAGVLAQLQQAGYPLSGADMLFYSTLPAGSGLSSSAAIEVLTGYALCGGAIDRTVLALLAQRAENQFVGVACGIMDQFIIANGQEGHALCLDCSTLAYEAVPFAPQGVELVILNSCSPRSLAHSAYNQRLAECQQALERLCLLRPMRNLCEAQPHELEWLKSQPLLFRRALHVVGEHRRVQSALRLARESEWSLLGALLNASHESLRNLYEVSGPRLDALVHAAQNAPGCLGARMTGAGFGGCAIALVRSSQLTRFTETVLAQYQQATGIHAEIYPATTADGVGRLVG